MTTSVDVQGRRFVVCSDCGAEGPHAKGNCAARELAKQRGWARGYPRGRGEDFRCPKCRRR